MRIIIVADVSGEQNFLETRELFIKKLKELEGQNNITKITIDTIYKSDPVTMGSGV